MCNPKHKPPNNSLRQWLPGRGNVLFTLLVGIILVWNQTAGATWSSSMATSTGTIAYQGSLADTAGNPITSQVAMTFRLYSVVEGGAPLWAEVWDGPNTVGVSAGRFNVFLGSLTPLSQEVFNNNSTLFLGITVATDSELSPRVQLGSAPYAVQALTLPDGSVTAAKLASGAVTQDKLDQTLNLVPAGGIILWDGALNELPTGWQLCDGSSGTPDLRDRFIVGAGNSYAIGNSGGAANVTLTVEQMPSHNHGGSTNIAGAHNHSLTIPEQDSANGSDAYANGSNSDPSNTFTTSTDGDHSHAIDSEGSGQPHENRPPYYALAFICKE